MIGDDIGLFKYFELHCENWSKDQIIQSLKRYEDWSKINPSRNDTYDADNETIGLFSYLNYCKCLDKSSESSNGLLLTDKDLNTFIGKNWKNIPVDNLSKFLKLFAVWSGYVDRFMKSDPLMTPSVKMDLLFKYLENHVDLSDYHEYDCECECENGECECECECECESKFMSKIISKIGWIVDKELLKHTTNKNIKKLVIPDTIKDESNQIKFVKMPTRENVYKSEFYTDGFGALPKIQLRYSYKNGVGTIKNYLGIVNIDKISVYSCSPGTNVVIKIDDTPIENIHKSEVIVSDCQSVHRSSQVWEKSGASTGTDRYGEIGRFEHTQVEIRGYNYYNSGKLYSQINTIKDDYDIFVSISW